MGRINIGNLLKKLFTKTLTEREKLVIVSIRIPRILAAILIGGSLSVSGNIFQAMFKNPLVSPDILGASAGSGFGAAIGIFYSLSYTFVSVISFLMGLFAVFLTYIVGRLLKIQHDFILCARRNYDLKHFYSPSVISTN